MSSRDSCRHGAQQGQREASIPGPEDVPILDASPGPLAQGLAAAASESPLSPFLSMLPTPGHRAAGYRTPFHTIGPLASFAGREYINSQQSEDHRHMSCGSLM